MELAPFIFKWFILHNFIILKKICKSPEIFTDGTGTVHNFNVGLQQLQKCLDVDNRFIVFLKLYYTLLIIS